MNLADAIEASDTRPPAARNMHVPPASDSLFEVAIVFLQAQRRGEGQGYTTFSRPLVAEQFVRLGGDADRSQRSINGSSIAGKQ